MSDREMLVLFWLVMIAVSIISNIVRYRKWVRWFDRQYEELENWLKRHGDDAARGGRDGA